MRRLVCLLLCLMLLPLTAALAEDPQMSIEPLTTTIRPGKAVLLAFTIPAAGSCDLYLRTDSGEVVQPVAVDFAVKTGVNYLWWNGTFQGVPVPAGSYQLALRFNDAETATPVSVGANAPYLTGIAAQKDAEADLLTVDFYASVDGLLTVGMWALY